MKKKKLPKRNKTPFFQSKKFFVLLFILCTISFILPIHFRHELRHLKSFGLIGLFLINFIGSATIFFPAPVILSVGIAGNLYNPFLVAIIASFGSALGEGTGYLFGYSSKEIVQFRHKKLSYQIITSLFHKYADIAILIFSIIPNPFIDGIGILAGLSGYSLTRFVVLVFIGRVVRNILVAKIGASL